MAENPWEQENFHIGYIVSTSLLTFIDSKQTNGHGETENVPAYLSI